MNRQDFEQLALELITVIECNLKREALQSFIATYLEIVYKQGGIYEKIIPSTPLDATQ